MAVIKRQWRTLLAIVAILAGVFFSGIGRPTATRHLESPIRLALRRRSPVWTRCERRGSGGQRLGYVAAT